MYHRTGVRLNPYTGETYETFENHLPPPNTTKGQFQESQLKHINPRLLHLTGAHDPTLRKREHDGDVFKHGGANPWGMQMYGTEVRNQLQSLVVRDVYNCRDGDYAVEPSFHGDKPVGYTGLVPQNHFRPYVQPTQELDTRGRMQSSETMNADMRKREQHTGEVFSRKTHALVTNRAVLPDTGVVAVAQIPIATADTQRGTTMQAYITPAFLDGATATIHAYSGDHLGSQREATNPVGHMHMDAPPTVNGGCESEIQGRVSSAQTLRLAGNPSYQESSSRLKLADARPTNKPEGCLPTGNAALERLGHLTLDGGQLRPTQQLGSCPITLPSGLNLELNTGLWACADVRDTGKGTLDTSRHVASITAPLADSAGVLQHVNRSTLKGTVDTSQRLASITAWDSAVVCTQDAQAESRSTLKGTVDTSEHVANITAPCSDTAAFVVQGVNRFTLKGTVPYTNRPSNISTLTQEGIAVMNPARDTHRRNNKPLAMAGITAVARGDIVVSTEAIRETLKTESPFRLNPVHPTHTGSIVMDTVHVRDTFAGHGECLPPGSVSGLGQGYVQLDESVRDTLRHMMPVAMPGASFDGQVMGDHLGPALTTTLQYRGVQEQGYVPEGLGVSSTRILDDFSYALREERVPVNYANADVVPIRERVGIPAARPTFRGQQEEAAEAAEA